MHHKNKRTVHKEVKRLDHKSARAKTRTAIEGGTPGAVHGMSWSNTLPQPPLIDEVGRHKSKTKKTRPKKDKCPHGKHEWYKEWVIEDHEFLTAYAYKVKVHRWTCIHCWKTKVAKRDYLWNHPRYPRPDKPRTAYRRPRG